MFKGSNIKDTEENKEKPGKVGRRSRVNMSRKDKRKPKKELKKTFRSLQPNKKEDHEIGGINFVRGDLDNDENKILDQEISQEDLEAELEKLSNNSEINGILLQLPLPKHLSFKKAVKKISPLKDIDGLHPDNYFALGACFRF